MKEILQEKNKSLTKEKQIIESRLSIINSILEDNEMKYQVTEKVIPEKIVYTAETVLKTYSDSMQWIPFVGQECLKLNPDMKCAEPPYEFCEYLDGEYKEADIRIRHNEAVTAFGKESELIKFKKLLEVKVLSIYHKGAYDKIGEAYAFLMKYAEENGYSTAGLARECYIDGIWNKESEEEIIADIKGQIRYIIHDPKISKVRKMLVIEQFQNDKLKKVQSKRSYEDILKYNLGQVRFLIREGVLRDEDPEIMAAQLAWPVSMWTNLCDREPEREAEVMELVDRHIRQFFRVYRK